MKKLYGIRDDSARQLVSMYFVADSEIEAIRQFKGFISQGNYPAYPKELTLFIYADVFDDGLLAWKNDNVLHSTDSATSYTVFDSVSLCRGDEIEEKYIEFSRMTKEDFNRLKVSKNVTEAEFDEEQKNGDFGK